MNPSLPKKHQSRSNRASSESAVVAPVTADAPDAGAVAGGAPRARTSLEASGAPGAGGLPATSGFPAVGSHGAGPWWPAASSFVLQSSPTSSEWIFLRGGFMNILQSPKVPFVNYPNVSQLPENFHFNGGPMNYTATPSPTGSSDVGAAQVGSQEKETIDVEVNDTIQHARQNARSNARSIATSLERSDRRLNWSIEEDIKLISTFHFGAPVC